MIQAVLFDVDFTLALPGPELGPDGYHRLGQRHGLALDVTRLDEARERAFRELQRQPDLVHDEELWVAFTELIIRGMGGEAGAARACAADMVARWRLHENFTLYEDVLPVLEELRRHGQKLGLVSNGERDLDEFVAHHALEVEPEAAAMVGDSYADDIEGARSLGMRAFLLDREGRYPDEPERLPTLLALPAALGLR